MELTKIITNFMYRIEPRPGGGFIARPEANRSDGQTMEPIEAATQEELQQKIEAKMTELLQQQMPNISKLGDIFKLGGIDFLKPSGIDIFKLVGTDAKVDRKINITTRSVFGKTITTRQEALPPGSDVLNVSTPIVPSSSGGTMLRVLAVLIVLILLYAFFHR